MQFSAFGLHSTILRGLDEMNFRRPTDIQYKAIRPILAGDDVLAIAQTGTGKTAAFAIPIIQKLVTRRRTAGRGIRCVVMEPTHELAHQTCEVFRAIGRHTGVKALALYGGSQQDPQIEALREGVDVLVATPGRLFDMVAQGHAVIDGIETLVLDEADHMLDLGFIHDIRDLMKRIPRRRQTLFFSATIDADIKRVAYSLTVRPINIRISPKNMVSRNVTHSVLHITMDEKRAFLERIYKEHDDCRILVFVRTKVRAERVTKAMARVGIEAACIHGDKTNAERASALESFRSGRVRMLIATDISARGIDIPAVGFVVNYDLPDLPENYVHRVGRTGRGMDKGYAVSFCAPEDEPELESIEQYLGGRIDEVRLTREEYESTLDFSAENDNDWQALLDNEERDSRQRRKPRRR